MPGRLVFATTADGASSPTDRLTIDSSGLVKLPDNGKFVAGAGSDLQIYHDGSNSFIKDTAGASFSIAATESIAIKTNNTEFAIACNKNGATELYYDGSKKFETISSGAKVTDELHFSSNGSLIKENQVKFSPSGSAFIDHATVDQDIIFRTSDASALDTTALTIDASDAGTAIFNHDVKIPDNGKFVAGASDDLQIYHEAGSHSFIRNYSGRLRIIGAGGGTNEDIQINAKDGEFSVRAVPNAQVELYYDHSLKLNTTANGVTCQDDLAVLDNNKLTFGDADDLQIFHDGSFNKILGSSAGNHIIIRPNSSDEGVFIRNNAAVELYYDGSKKFETTSAGTKHGDAVKGAYGNDQDLLIYHESGINYIQTFNSTNLEFYAGSDKAIVYETNGSVELYHDNTKKAETTSSGFKVTGACFVNDGSATGNRISVGNGGDLKIFHTNPGSFIQDTSLRLVISSNVVDISDTNGDKMAEFTQNSSAKLYHNGSQKLATSSSGISVTGTVSESSDIALKSDIQPLTNSLKKIQQITGYRYKLDNVSINSMGVIAQDVEKVFPELVHGSEGNKTLQYSGLIGVLVEAVKDLSAKVAALEAA